MLSFPRVTEMFQFTRFPLPALCVQAGVTPHDGCWVSPFGYPRIEAWSAAPRGLSQPPTSFIGFRRQGIHRWLFVAWRTKMLVLALEFSRNAPGTTAVGRLSVGRRCRRREQGVPNKHSLKTEQRALELLGLGLGPSVLAVPSNAAPYGAVRRPVINVGVPSLVIGQAV